MRGSETKWVVPGVYEVYSCHQMSPSRHLAFGNFALKLYWEEGSPSQFFATFKFNAMEGLMRLRPGEPNLDDLSEMTFEKACEVPASFEPGFMNSMWRMKLIGKGGGPEPERPVFSQPLTEGEFSFETPKDSFRAAQEPISLGLELRFIIWHNDNKLYFRARKVKELRARDIPQKVPLSAATFLGIDEEWQALKGTKLVLRKQQLDSVELVSTSATPDLSPSKSEISPSTPDLPRSELEASASPAYTRESGYDSGDSSNSSNSLTPGINGNLFDVAPQEPTISIPTTQSDM